MRIIFNRTVQIGLLIFISALIRVYYVYAAGPGFFPDSTQYLSMAVNLIENNRFESFGAMFPDIMRPVLYPLMVSIVYLLSGKILFSGAFVSILAGCLAVILIYFIAEELFDQLTAIIAAGITAVHPTLVSVSTYCLTDELALAFLLSAYLFGIKWIKEEKYHFALLTGFCFALGFLSRQIIEIHFYSFIIFLTIKKLWEKKYRIWFRQAPIILISFFIAMVPYLIFTFQHTGKIVLNTGKDYYGVKDYVLQHKINDGFYDKIADHFKNPSSELKRGLDGEIMFRALNDKNDDLLAFDYYFKKIEPTQKISPFIFISSEKIKKTSVVIFSLLKLLGYSFGILMIFAILGFGYGLIKRNYWELLFAGFAVAADLLFISQSHLEDRHAINILSFIAIITAYGFKNSLSFSGKFRSVNRAKIYKGLFIFILMIGLVLFLPKFKNYMDANKMEMERLSNVVNAFSKEIEPNSIIAARYPMYVFLLKGKYVPLPIAEYEGTLKYLKNKKAGYLILSPDAIQLRPFFNLEKISGNQKFRIIKEIVIDKKPWVLYKIQNI